MQVMTSDPSVPGVPVTGGSPRAWLSRSLLAQLGRYIVVGALATAANAVLFFGLRTWWPPVPASLASLVLSTAFSTEANRRFTFAGSGMRLWRVYLQGVGTVVFYAGYSAVVLVVLAAMFAAPTRLHETLAIAAASVLGGTSRFLLLRHWVFVPEPAVTPAVRRPAERIAPSPVVVLAVVALALLLGCAGVVGCLG